MTRYLDHIAKHQRYATVPGYWTRHETALNAPQGAEEGMVDLLRGWLAYADHHSTRFESGIGEDYVLGPRWAEIGAALRGLLNGELGRLDAGALDTLIGETLKAEGFNPDTL